MHPRIWNRIFTVLFLMAFVAGVIQPAALAASIERETAAPATQEDALAKIEPLVLEEIAENGQTEFFVWLTAKADLSPAKDLKTKLEKGQFVYDALRATADSSQAALRAELDAQRVEYRPFYISNKIFVYSGSESLVMSLATRSDVAKITPNRQFQLDEPMISPRAPENTTAIEPNISFIRAPEVWDLGFRGEGLVMAGNDTGLDWDHPAIINQYRGWDGATADHNYNWWDATGAYPSVPGDGHGHGTHTTGTMVGDDGGDNQIGVAPGAQTVHCKNMTDGGSGSDFTFSTCFEWDLAPWDLNQENPRPDLAPHAINNSWGYWGGNQPQFEDEIAALQAAGIVVEVSAGNEGSSCGTLRSPGDYVQVMTTGSVNHAGGVLPGTLTGFSSRGPSSLYPDDYFPDIMAPGENIRSSVPGGGYQGGWSGTSMSGPHSTALIALMWQAAPGFLGMVEETYDIIHSTAVPLTGVPGSNCGGDYDVGPNNDWGFGTIDALAAVEEAMRLDNPYRLVITPEAQEVCTPDGFSYNVDVLQNEPDFEEPVILSAFGGPPDYTPSFDVNPVIPPGSSTLSFSNGGPSAHGSYSIDVLGMALTYTVTSTVSVGVFTETPGTISLTAPADGATFVDLRPTFEWTAAVQGSTYHLEVAGDPGFGTVVYEAIVSGISHQMEAVLDPVTEYWWRATPLNACGEGLTSEIFSFTTRDIPPVLLVDDDNNSPDVRSYYTDALDSLGLFYDVWDTNGSDNEPSAFDLAPYEFVVWFTGVLWGGTAGPGPAGEAALGEWLDGGGCFLISSQDYLYDRGLTGFMQDYLGVSSYTNDVSQTTVTGAGSVFGELGPYTLSYPFSNFSDRISPDASAELAFAGNAGDAAVNKDGGAYQSTFWGFPLEALPEAGRGETLQAVVDWCGVGGETGFIAGTVTDAIYGDPIAGASVAAGGRAVLTDASGEYSMRLPVGVYDVTASAENYMPETVTGVEVLLDQTTTVDFELEGSSLYYSPEFIEETMQVGEIMSTTVTVYNTGPLPIDFSVRIKDFSGPDQASSSPVSIPRFEGELPAKTEPLSTGRAPVNVEKAELETGVNPLSLLGAPAYALDVYPGNNLVMFPDVDVPGSWNVVASVPQFHPAADFLNGDFSKLYALDYDTNQFVTIDTTTGARTVIGTTSPNGNWSGMTGASDGTLYVASSVCGSSSTLYTIDPATGVLTTVGPIGAGTCIIDIAINAQGEMFGVDIVSDMLYGIDTATGAGTPIGSTGVAANYAQGMDFEEESGILYWASYSASGAMRIIDTATGASTLVGAFPGGAEVDGLAFATGGTSANWAYAVPDGGTVDPGEEFTFEVVFDATSLLQVGTYTANLSFTGSFVNDPPVMPLTMHLACDTCGFLEGDITDAITGDPLVADITIEGLGGVYVSLTGDSYYVSVPADTYTISVEADGYFPEEATVVVGIGETIMTDFALMLIFSELAYEPEAFVVDVPVGTTHTETLVVSNLGTQAFDFALVDLELSAPEGGAIASNPAITCLPDAFGYTCTDSTEPDDLVSYNFEDISGTGIPVTLGDDEVSSAIPMYFDFNYYGTDYIELYISSNGFLTVLPGQSSGCCTGGELPSPTLPNGVISGWWEDLNPSAGGTIHYQTLGSEPFRYFIVQFTNVPHYPSGNLVTKQYKLFEGSNNIEVHYMAAPSDGGTHSAGIENEDGTIGLQYYRGTSALQSELAVCYLYPGQYFCGSGGEDAEWLTQDPDAGTVEAGESFEVIVIFDATEAVLGTYTAEVYFSGSFDNVVLPLPVTMNVVEVEYGLEVNWSDSELSGGPGEMATFEATVTNMGNVPDTFDLTFEDNLWDVVIDPEEISLWAGESAQVSVMVYIPGDAEDGDWDDVMITVVSRGDPEVWHEATLKTTAVVVGDPPAAGFSFAPDEPVAGEEITFTNTTTGTEPIIYAWNFGDGGSSTAEHPTHVYAEAGSYVVTLTATNAFGEDTFTETIVVTAVEPPIISIFLPVVIQ